MAKLLERAPIRSSISDRANLEHLRKLSKARPDLRACRPDAQLADAQLEIARANGFSSWRALKGAFDDRAAESGKAVGDWIGHPEGGVPLALHVRDEGGRLHAQLDVPSLGYFGDPVEALSVGSDRMTFRVTVRGVNALFDGSWCPAVAEWQGVFTHDGRTQRLHLQRGAYRAPRVTGLDGLWDGRSEEGPWLTFRIVTDDKGTFAWLSTSAAPGRWFQVSRIEHLTTRVVLEMKTLRFEGDLAAAGDRIEGQVVRQGGAGRIELVRRDPGAPTPWPPAKGAP